MSAFAQYQVSVFAFAADIYKKFSALSQEELNQWAKRSKIEFAVKAGTRAVPEFEIHKFENSKLKVKKVFAFQKNKKGGVKALKVEGELYKLPEYENVVKQMIVQKIVFDLRAEFFKEAEKDADGKKIKGTGSKNITPFGVACKEMFTLLGVENKYKYEIDGSGLKQVLITEPQTEAQKESLLAGQKSKARKGVKKGKSQKTIQLETSLEQAKKEMANLKGFMIYLYTNGSMALDENDEKMYHQVVKDTEEDDAVSYRCGMGLPDGDIPKSPTPEPESEISRDSTPELEEEREDYFNTPPPNMPPARGASLEEEEEEQEFNEEDMLAMIEMEENEGPEVSAVKDVTAGLLTDTEDEEEELVDDEDCEEYVEEQSYLKTYVMEDPDEYPDFNCYMKKIKKEQRAAGGVYAERWKTGMKKRTIDNLLTEWLESLRRWDAKLCYNEARAETITTWAEVLEDRLA